MVLDLSLRPEEEAGEDQQLLLETPSPIRPIPRRTEWGRWHPEECQSRQCHHRLTWWWLRPNEEEEAVGVVLNRMAVCSLVVVEVEDVMRNVALESV